MGTTQIQAIPWTCESSMEVAIAVANTRSNIVSALGLGNQDD
ncbi:hypothetical protein [Oligella ureolytica]|nr:hypothetical protein [Oligella ureolytica]